MSKYTIKPTEKIFRNMDLHSLNAIQRMLQEIKTPLEQIYTAINDIILDKIVDPANREACLDIWGVWGDETRRIKRS